MQAALEAVVLAVPIAVAVAVAGMQATVAIGHVDRIPTGDGVARQVRVENSSLRDALVRRFCGQAEGRPAGAAALQEYHQFLRALVTGGHGEFTAIKAQRAVAGTKRMVDHIALGFSQHRTVGAQVAGNPLVD